MNNGVFFCDIQNTFTGGINRNESIQRLIENINTIKEIKKLNKLEFCFVTSDTMDYLLEYIKEILPYLEKNEISLGTCFCDNKQIDNNGNITSCSIGKIDQINKYIEKRDDITDIFFADDSKPLIEIETVLIIKKFPHINCKLFRPKDGIDSLNQLLNNYIEDFNKLKRKI